MSMVGVILAGGKSTRMKQDKALLRFEGTSLLQYQFSLLEKHLGKGQVLVSGDRPEFPHVKDLVSGLGPLEGLRSVCRHLLHLEKKGGLLVIPVDMPFISDAGLSRLLHYQTKLDMAKFSAQQLPIVIHNLHKILTRIEAMEKNITGLSKGSFSFNHLFTQCRVEEIPAEDDGFFTNINTPEDWNAALS